MAEARIPSLLTTLLDRLTGKEDLDLEFKAAKHTLPKSLWSTVSAFANTRGGWIVLGVDERTLAIEGVDQPHKVLQDFHNLARNPQKVSVPMCGADDASIEMLNDKHLIVLRVPAASRKLRPIYVNANPYTGTYVRRNEGDYCCNKAEVDRMMRESSDVAADSTILLDFAWDDLDHESLARYRRRFQTRDPSSPRNSYDDRLFLRTIGGFRRDRETGREGITVAGLLFFGTARALREWRTRHLIDYRLVPEDPDSDTRWEDRIAWEGNLLDAYETIYPRLVAGLPVPFTMKGDTRVDESPVHVVLREALVNLLAHADYADTQASLVVRSRAQGGFYFRNPGSSRVLQADLLRGDHSDPRNPELVHMFRLLGLAEEAGTGIPRIFKAWRDLGFRPPTLEVGTERDGQVLILL